MAYKWEVAIIEAACRFRIAELAQSRSAKNWTRDRNLEHQEFCNRRREAEDELKRTLKKIPKSALKNFEPAADAAQEGEANGG